MILLSNRRKDSRSRTFPCVSHRLLFLAADPQTQNLMHEIKVRPCICWKTVCGLVTHKKAQPHPAAVFITVSYKAIMSLCCVGKRCGLPAVFFPQVSDSAPPPDFSELGQPRPDHTPLLACVWLVGGDLVKGRFSVVTCPSRLFTSRHLTLFNRCVSGKRELAPGNGFRFDEPGFRFQIHIQRDVFVNSRQI